MLETIFGIICVTLSVIGAIAFAFNLAPQVWGAYKTKETGLTNGFFVLALAGNIGSAAGVFWNNLQTGVWQWQLYGNYLVATAFTVTLLVMKIKYKK